MRIIVLTSSDGFRFELDSNSLYLSITLKTMVDNNMGTTSQGVISLKRLHSSTLKTVVDWMNEHIDDPYPDDERRVFGNGDDYYSSELYEFDLELLNGIRLINLFQLQLAATYLGINGLIVFASMGVVRLLKKKGVVYLLPHMSACYSLFHNRLLEDLTPGEKDTLKWMYEVDAMENRNGEVIHFGSFERKLTKEEEKEHKEWAKKVEEMQPYIDQVVVFDPENCARMANLLRSMDLWEQEEHLLNVESMQADIDQIVDFGTCPPSAD